MDKIDIKNKTLIDWICGKGIWNKKGIQPSRNKEESKWGCSLINKNSKMWSACLGETIVKELLENQGEKVWRPKKINGFQPDLETEEFIYEVKTRNWTTNGTAGEKILGVGYKYADIPELYGKNLKIVLVGYQEYEASNKFELFEPKSENRRKIIQLLKEIGIEYIKCSDLII